jgi:hypothetical protein
MEITVLQRTHHPNLLHMLDFAEDDDFFYIVTELHGSPWTKISNQSKGSQNPDKQPVGLSNNSAASLLSLDSSLLKLLRQRPSCDLFECIDARTYFLLLLTLFL